MYLKKIVASVRFYTVLLIITFRPLNLFDKRNIKTKGDNCVPVLTRCSRSAGSPSSYDSAGNRTFFTKSKILEKEVKQVQGDGEMEIQQISNV